MVAKTYNFGVSFAEFTCLDKASKLDFVASQSTVTLYLKRRLLNEILDKYPNEKRKFL